MFIDNYLNYLQEDDLDEGKVGAVLTGTKAALQRVGRKAGDISGLRQVAIATKRKKLLAAAAKKRGQSSIAAMKGAKALQKKALQKAALRTGGATAAVGAAGYGATRK